MGEMYKIIFETSRALKPYSVTQTCPCGTTPNMAWLPFVDQAVTADPVGSVQVRRRIKLYKALLGPRSAVYGDHVELSKILFDPRQRDRPRRGLRLDRSARAACGDQVHLAGLRAALRGRVSHAAEGRHLEEVDSPSTTRRCSRKGTFRNLYEIGYDSPEGYAIAKDGKMYYAFFVDAKSPAWKGTLELRGLATGPVPGIRLCEREGTGNVDAANPRLATEFQDQLLVELARQ